MNSPNSQEIFRNFLANHFGKEGRSPEKSAARTLDKVEIL